MAGTDRRQRLVALPVDAGVADEAAGVVLDDEAGGEHGCFLRGGLPKAYRPWELAPLPTGLGVFDIRLYQYSDCARYWWSGSAFKNSDAIKSSYLLG